MEENYTFDRERLLLAALKPGSNFRVTAADTAPPSEVGGLAWVQQIFRTVRNQRRYKYRATKFLRL